MATVTINVPAKITITNNSSKALPFVPKGQNFSVVIKAGDSLEFKVDTALEVFYYLGQASADFSVTQASVSE